MKLQVVELGGYLNFMTKSKNIGFHLEASGKTSSAEPRVVHIYFQCVVVSKQTCTSFNVQPCFSSHLATQLACTVWKSNAYCCIVVAPAGHASAKGYFKGLVHQKAHGHDRTGPELGPKNHLIELVAFRWKDKADVVASVAGRLFHLVA